mgnify:CR=1 FL=1
MESNECALAGVGIYFHCAIMHLHSGDDVFKPHAGFGEFFCIKSNTIIFNCNRNAVFVFYNLYIDVSGVSMFYYIINRFLNYPENYRFDFFR